MWIIKAGGREVSSDDFTLAELERVEKESEVPWSVANPMRSAAVARAFLKVAVRRTGGVPGEVDTWTLRTIKTAFEFRPDEPIGDAEEEVEAGDQIPLDLSSRASSHGASDGSTGRPKKRAASA